MTLADCFSSLPFVASYLTTCSVTAAVVLSNVSMCSSESAAVRGKLFLLTSASLSSVCGFFSAVSGLQSPSGIYF